MNNDGLMDDLKTWAREEAQIIDRESARAKPATHKAQESIGCDWMHETSGGFRFMIGYRNRSVGSRQQQQFNSASEGNNMSEHWLRVPELITRLYEITDELEKPLSPF